MLPITIRSLFELRKSIYLSQHLKISSGRCIIHKGKFGIYDATGLIWPINFKDKSIGNQFREGDFITFSTQVDFLWTIENLKYKDNDFIINIIKVINKTECVDNSLEKDYFEATNELPTDVIPSGTLLWKSPAHKKLNLIKTRNYCVERMKRFFRCFGFTEMDTPILVPMGGMETYLTPFSTVYSDHKGKDHKLELPTSPEFALKKVLTQGHSKIFQLAKSFRNKGEVSRYHEPEFLMLEWYQVGGGLNELMKTTKDLICALATSLGIDLSKEPSMWPSYSVTDLLKTYAGFSLEEVQDIRVFRAKAVEVSKSCKLDDDWDTLFSKVFMDCVEPWLKTQRFCFVYNFPAQLPGLAKIQGHFSRRLELYSNGVELSNGYEELNDWTQYAQRWSSLNDEPNVASFPDMVFLKKMQFGLPDCCGNALGVDRLIAVLLGLDAIAPLLPLPFLSQFFKGQVAEE